MKLLILTESLLERVGDDYYGVDTWIRLPQFLAAHGASVTLWAPVRAQKSPSPGTWRIDLSNLTVQHHDAYHSYATCYRLWPRRVLAWRKRAARLAAEHDVVVLRLPSPMISLCTRAARRAETPLVLLVAGDTYAQSDRIESSRGLRRVLYRQFTKMLVRQERRCARQADLVYVYSEELAARHRQTARTVRRLRTPHLSVADIVEREDTCASEETRLLRVCWLLPTKGLEHLLEAVALLKDRGRRVTLDVIGKERVPGYGESLRARARDLGVADMVSFVGWVPFDQMRDVYLARDIQVISSLAEGTPRCILEGAARGLPLVSTTAGGSKDVLQHERTALLVDPGQAAALAAAIERVIDDGELRRRMIREGYRMAREATFEGIGVKFLNDLKRLLTRDEEPVASSSR